MKPIPTFAVGPAVLLLLASPAPAQTNVSPLNKSSWSENCGWMNWRDAGPPPGSRGARVHPTFLSGSVWGENIGWIILGDGSPVNGTTYGNVNGADSGVNRDFSSGSLSGKAWGENVGWINFTGGSLASPPNPARFDAAAARLRGFAWGENIGWINLDNTAAFVGFNVCTADFNDDGAVNSQDFFDFLTAFFASLPSADFNHDAHINSQDFFDFLAAFFAAC